MNKKLSGILLSCIISIACFTHDIFARGDSHSGSSSRNRGSSGRSGGSRHVDSGHYDGHHGEHHHEHDGYYDDGYYGDGGAWIAPVIATGAIAGAIAAETAENE